MDELQDIQFITPDELVSLLGDSAIRAEGFSWIMYDVPQFMSVSCCFLFASLNQHSYQHFEALLSLVGGNHPGRLACVLSGRT